MTIRTDNSVVIARLTRERDEALAEARTLRNAVVGMQEEVERLREDAERYRWLKEHKASDGATGLDTDDITRYYRTREWDEMIDAAIDAAMQKGE